MILVLTATHGFALWQKAGAVPQSPVRLTPQRLSRLALPVYGAEHLLIFTGESESDRVLPVLLRYREGDQLEQLDEQMARAEPFVKAPVICPLE